MRIAVRAGALALALSVAFPMFASAHPLGNFAVNRYAGLELRPEGLSIDYVLDLAEIPTVQLRAAIAPDSMAACASIADQLTVVLDGTRRAIRVDAGRVAFTPGQAGLDTLRLECSLRAAWSLDAAMHGLSFSDATFAQRIGWREITAQADGVAIETDLPSVSVSSRLTAYPRDAYTSSVDVRNAEIRFTLDATARPPARTMPLAPGSDGIGGVLGDLGSLPVLLAFGVAVVLGALHAATPGHGKTIMAAYLVGTRGSLRDAVALGLTVAVAHTTGVLALALIVLGGVTLLPAERLYPILSTVSALVVVVLGLAMLSRELRHRAAHRHVHRHAHAAESGRTSLVALGVAGGIVPSASALVLLLGPVAAHRADLGVLLVVGFGIGMAITLVGAGVALVATSRALQRVTLPPRLLALAPILAAVTMLAVGLGLTAQSLAGLI